MWKEYSEAIFRNIFDNGDATVECNQRDEEQYIKNLKGGRSFLIDLGTHGNDGFSMSIEEAVKLRDWLNGMIYVAEDCGYLKKDNSEYKISTSNSFSNLELLEHTVNMQWQEHKAREREKNRLIEEREQDYQRGRLLRETEEKEEEEMQKKIEDKLNFLIGKLKSKGVKF